MLTLRVPSFVAAMTTLFRESVTMPQMALSLSFALTVPCIRAITSGGRSPMSRDFRLKPDCMFHTRIAPVDVPARPKFPQAVTQTAWIDVHYSQRIGEGDACITKDIISILVGGESDCRLVTHHHKSRSRLLFFPFILIYKRKTPSP